MFFICLVGFLLHPFKSGADPKKTIRIKPKCGSFLAQVSPDKLSNEVKAYLDHDFTNWMLCSPQKELQDTFSCNGAGWQKVGSAVLPGFSYFCETNALKNPIWLNPFLMPCITNDRPFNSDGEGKKILEERLNEVQILQKLSKEEFQSQFEKQLQGVCGAATMKNTNMLTASYARCPKVGFGGVSGVTNPEWVYCEKFSDGIIKHASEICPEGNFFPALVEYDVNGYREKSYVCYEKRKSLGSRVRNRLRPEKVLPWLLLRQPNRLYIYHPLPKQGGIPCHQEFFEYAKDAETAHVDVTSCFKPLPRNRK